MGVLRPIKGFYNDLPNSLDAHKQVRRWFNQMGMKGERLAKGRAPVDTGALRASISWAMTGTQSTRKGGPLQGRLAVGVVYGRRQEWEHQSRAFYLYDSVLDVAREIEQTLQSDAASVWIGTGRGYRGTPSFNPGISTGPTFGAFSRSFDQGVAGGGVAGSGRVGGVGGI